MKLASFAALLALVVGAASVSAQFSPPGTGGLGADLTPFFGENKAFSANAEVKARVPNQDKVMTIPMKFATLDGKLRNEIDVAEIKDASFPPSAVPMMKQMGMDKTVSITQPDKGTVLMIYPGLKAYAAISIGAKPADAPKTPKLEKSNVGKETIDGHDCDKNKISFSDEKGQKHEALVWNATDLKGFPVQIQMDESGSTTTIKFSNPILEKPDAKLFDPPAEYTRYEGVQQLMQAVMMQKAATLQSRPPK